MNGERRDLIPESKIVSSVLENVEKGVDPHRYAERSATMWSGYSTQDQLDDLIEVLNPRGMREAKLQAKLQKMKDKISSKISSCVLFKSEEEAKPTKSKPIRNDVIDKSIFRTMEDFLEANLRDQLLDLEERLWQASLGIIKVDDRDKWRDDIASKINKLLMGKVDDEDEELQLTGKALKSEDRDAKEEYKQENVQENGGHNLENGISSPHGNDLASMEVDEDVEKEIPRDDSMNNELDVSGEKDLTPSSKKSLPLKFIDQVKREDSRCNTPVNISTPMINPKVRILAAFLLEVIISYLVRVV